MPDPWRSQPHLVALALFGVLALIIGAPVLGDPTRLALGHPENDVWNHVWGYWWVSTELWRGELPVHTPLLNWPGGGSLWFIDAFNVVATLPVNYLFGPVAAYNLAVIGNFLFCGIGAYALTLRVTGFYAAALLGGVAWMTSPHLLGQAYNGISETLSAGWLPLALLFAREAVAEARPREAALGGLVLGVTALANWYYGLFAGLCVTGLLIRAALWRRPPGGVGRWLLALFLYGATAGLIVAGPFSLFFQTMDAADAVVTRDPDFVWATLILHNMTDVVSMVRPGKHYSPDLLRVFGEHLIVVVYVGASILVPALLAPLVVRKSALRGWALMAGFFGLLTLGPFLYIGGDYVQVMERWIPLPFLALFQWFPLFSRISHAYRCVMGLTLGLILLMGLFLRGARQRGWPAGALALGLGLARVAESFWGSPAVFPLPAARFDPPPIYAALTGGAVLDLPVGVPVLSRSSIVAYQIVHQQPIPYGLNDPTPPVLYYNRFTQYLLELERDTVTLLPARAPLLDIALGRQAAMDAGLRWVVLHKDRFPASQLEKVSAFLDRAATARYDDERVRVYELVASDAGSRSAK